MPAVLAIASAPLISFTTKVGKLHSPLILIDQMKADQIGQIAHRQMLRLRNTKGDATEADFFARTERCFKTTFHGLPPSSCSMENLGANRPRVTALSAFGLSPCPRHRAGSWPQRRRPLGIGTRFPKTSNTERAMAGACGGECCSRLTRAVKNVYGGDR